MLHDFSDSVTLNLKKATGTLAKVQEMVDANAYCMDIAQQINAAIGLLRAANNLIVESHMRTCGHRLAGDNELDKDAFIKEILQVCNITARKK